MSKVIKSSPDFVAGRIFPATSAKPAVWGKIAQRVEERQSPPAEKQPPPEKQPDADTVEKQASSSFDTDFSAPDSHTGDPKQEDSEKSKKSEPKIPQVDLDALMEEYFNKGLQAGLERAEIDYGSSVKALQIVCEQLSGIRETILSNSMEEMKNLVMLIAEKIIRHSVASQKETIVQTVEYAIQNAVKSDEFVISVNVDDYTTIKSRSADFINSISGLDNIIVKADPAIDQGGCLIESNNCTVDATIATQLDVIMEKFKSE